MDIFRKAFLFIVGAVSVAYEEATKAAKEAQKSVEERREKVLEHAPKVHA